MIFLYIALGVLALAISIFLVVSSLLVHWMTHPKFDNRDARKALNQTKGFLVGTENFKREPFVFEMRDGYKIHGDISINNPKKFVVFGHGHGSTREGSMRFARLFYKLGYSIVLYDHRGHGDNERTYPTMGKRESFDMVEIVHQIKRKYGYDSEIGLFGCSMGGATTGLASRMLNKEIKFAILDCPYSSLKNLIIGICKTHHIPAYPTIWIVNAIATIFYKFSMKDIDLSNESENFDVPTCFFHGKKDNLVLCENSEMLYNKTKSELKVLKMFDNAGHAQCVEFNYDEYFETVVDFLKSIGEEYDKKRTFKA